MRYLIVILSLFLFLGSVTYAQDTTSRNEQATALLNDAESIPSDFARLAQQLNFSKWDSSCSKNGIEIAKSSVMSWSIALKAADYMVGTVRMEKAWSLPQVAQTGYVFSLGVPLIMTLSRAAHCTGQQALSDDFIVFALRLIDAADNAHKYEMLLIQDEEDIIERLTPKKEPKYQSEANRATI